MSRRTALLGALIAVAAVGLTACQPAAGAAAFVGGQRVTDDQLRTDLNEAFADPQVKAGVTKQYGSDLSAYRRQLLNDLVRHLLIVQAQGRTGVQVADTDVTRLIDNDGGAAKIRDADHLSADLIKRRYKDLLLTTELGYTQQHVKRPTEADLRASYERERDNQTQARLGLLAVPDQNTLNQVIAQLRADPSKWSALAAKYPGSAPEATPYPPANIPPDIRPKILAAQPNTFLPFVGPGQNGEGQFLVVKVYGVTTPTFEQMRTQLSLQSLSEAYDAGKAYLGTLATRLGVRVNPRYGTWNDKTAQIDDAPNPVVTLPPTATPTPSATAPSGS